MTREKRFYVREFDAERDYEGMCGWWIERELFPVPVQLIPKLAVVACKTPDGPALGFACLYMDNSINLARVEHILTKPGLKLKETRKAFRALVEYMELVAKEQGYVWFVSVTYPSIAREAKALGFTTTLTGLVQIVKEIK